MIFRYKLCLGIGRFRGSGFRGSGFKGSGFKVKGLKSSKLQNTSVGTNILYPLAFYLCPFFSSITNN
jgi:hypothetical protein